MRRIYGLDWYGIPSGISRRKQGRYAESDPSEEASDTADDGEHREGKSHVGWVHMAESVAQKREGCARPGDH